MGHIFKQSYTVTDKKTGERIARQTKKWYVEYRIPGEPRPRRVPGYRDKKATEQLLAQLERDAARVASGLLPAEHNHARRPLADHLAEYLEHLANKDNTAAHVELVKGRCERILAGCKLERWAQLDAHRLEAFLAGLRGGKQKLSNQTSNDYLQQFRSFIRWLAARLKSADPLAELKPLNVAVDRRRVRRALVEAEFARLVQAAAGSADLVFCQDGPARAMLYTVAAYTGLRASELASLTPESIYLDGEPALLQVEAGYSKRRRLDTVPILPALVTRLKEWLADRPTGKPLWPGQWAAQHNAAKMLRVDLKTAGIRYRDSRGKVFDFHALRGQFITGLARAGVSLVEAQRLARHSTPNLTSNYYSHLEIEDLGRAVEKLPVPPGGSVQAAAVE